MVQQPPDSFVCPVTLKLFVDPVICSDGHSYERVAIEDWIEKKGTSPITNQIFTTKEVIPNITLRKAVEDWKEQEHQESNYNFTLNSEKVVGV